jgi:hypothetical protein
MPKQPPIFTLDITTRDRYLANIEQYGMAALKPPLAEVHIVVPTDLDMKQRVIGIKNDTITLFVAPGKDNYIIGFRGANLEPYCLRDAGNVDSFQPLLAAALDVPKDNIKASKIRADHRALGVRPRNLFERDFFRHFKG